MHGAGKTIVDVSRISEKHMKKGSPHQPVTKCTREVFIKPNKSPLVVRHYLGTLEQYSFRKDARQADNMKTKEVRGVGVKHEMWLNCINNLTQVHYTCLLFASRS